MACSILLSSPFSSRVSSSILSMWRPAVFAGRGLRMTVTVLPHEVFRNGGESQCPRGWCKQWSCRNKHEHPQIHREHHGNGIAPPNPGIPPGQWHHGERHWKTQVEDRRRRRAHARRGKVNKHGRYRCEYYGQPCKPFCSSYRLRSSHHACAHNVIVPAERGLPNPREKKALSGAPYCRTGAFLFPRHASFLTFRHKAALRTPGRLWKEAFHRLARVVEKEGLIFQMVPSHMASICEFSVH